MTTMWFQRDNDPWPAIRFQPILFLFLWIANWHIVFPGGGNASIDTLGIGAWEMWLGTGFICPPLLLLSWWLIEKCNGRWRYRGMWLRLAADMGELGVVVAFLWARLASADPYTDARVYGWIAISSMVAFLLVLVGRDIAMLGVVERLATKTRARDRHA